MANTSAEKISRRLKGLHEHLREGEQPLYSIPAIWENATTKQSNAGDLVLTNQRLFGYIYTTFPRERLFLDDLELDRIKIVSIKEKSFEAVFRELFVSDGEKRIYIRATRKKIEETYTTLQATLAEYAPAALTANARGEATESQGTEQTKPPAGPIYGRQQVRQPLERSALGITILLVGGLLLEIVGALAWAITGSLQTGMPLFLAGIVAVIVATLARRQRNSG
jgi:hypothetical protein